MTISDLFDERLVKWIQDIHDISVKSSLNIDLHYAATKNWSVVPVESGMHFSDLDVKRLVKVSLELSVSKIMSLTIDGYRDECPYRSFEPNCIDLKQWDASNGHFNCLLVPDNLSYLILCTVEDYFLVASEVEFLELFLGKKIKSARAEFLEYASHQYLWSKEKRYHMKGIAHMYDC